MIAIDGVLLVEIGFITILICISVYIYMFINTVFHRTIGLPMGNSSYVLKFLSKIMITIHADIYTDLHTNHQFAIDIWERKFEINKSGAVIIWSSMILMA